MTLEVLRSNDLAPLSHGFFTRKGGASSGVFEGLNCGPGSSDQAEMVAINRARVAAVLNVPQAQLVTVHQVHSAEAVPVTGPHVGPAPRADAMVTKTPGVALGILTADCGPVLFADPKAGVVGGAHAGWKGTLGGILESTLAAMRALGAVNSNITAVLGPTISQKAYEVGPEFLDTFRAEDPEAVRYFANGAGNRYQFDLPGYTLSRLRAAGVKQANWIGHCTYSDPARFFSYRRSVHEKEVDYGRLIAAIRL